MSASPGGKFLNYVGVEERLKQFCLNISPEFKMLAFDKVFLEHDIWMTLLFLVTF